MAVTRSQKQIVSFFFKGGATSALFLWLEFRLFVAQKKLKLDGADAPSLSVLQYLNQWQQQASFVVPARWFLILLNAVVALIGFGAMAGVLNVGGEHVVNIWVPLAMFAFLPLIMTLSSAYFSLVSGNKQQLSGHPWLTFLVAKLNLTPYLAYKSLLLPWLFLQSQILALVFSLSALLSFFVLATFQDYHFGWSSTLIADNNIMVQIMAKISLPWHWLVAAPTTELIEQTRIVTQVGVSAEHLPQRWWTTLVMAIVVYGLLPRLMLSLALRQKFIGQLKASIMNNADVEQFVIAQQHQLSRNPLASEDEFPQPESVIVDSEDVAVITWQQSASNLKRIKNLGSDDWLVDDAWLSSEQSQLNNPVLVVVDPMQTPTGELADCIQALQQKNKSVTLVLFSEQVDEGRQDTQLKSWQFFAQRYQIVLQQGMLK